MLEPRHNVALTFFMQILALLLSISLEVNGKCISTDLFIFKFNDFSHHRTSVKGSL